MPSAIQISNSGANNNIPFGSVAFGGSLTFHLPITNFGSSNLIITALTITPLTALAGDFSYTVTLPLTIAPAATDESVTVTFTPTAARGTFETATLVITSNAVAGVSSYNLTGTSVKLGSATPFNPTPTSESASSTSIVPGHFPVDSSSSVWLNQSTTGDTVTVSVTCDASGVFGPGSGGTSNIYWEYSLDGGVTWTTFFSWTASDIGNTITMPTTLQSFSTTSCSNLNLLQVRVEASADIAPGSDTSVTANGSVSAIQATVTVNGDFWIQVVQTSAAANQIAPVGFFGNVNIGTAYLSDLFTITNPTPTPITITLTPDAPNGFALSGLTGSLLLAAFSGSTVTFKIQITPLSHSVQDDFNSVIAALIGHSSSVALESFFTSTLLTPAFILLGDQEETAVAINGSSSTASYYNAAGLLNDAAVLLSRQYYIDQPQINKSLNRIWLLFERLAAFTLSCVASVVNPKNQPNTPTLQVVNASTDGTLGIGVFDFQITGSCVTITYSMPAGTGQFSLVGFVLKVDEIGEVIENT